MYDIEILTQIEHDYALEAKDKLSGNFSETYVKIDM